MAVSVSVPMSVLVLIDIFSIFEHLCNALNQRDKIDEISTEFLGICDLKEVQSLSLLGQAAPTTNTLAVQWDSEYGYANKISP